MEIDRLMLAIIQREDADDTIEALNKAGLGVTVIASTGGFWGASNVTLLVGLSAAEVDKAVGVIKARTRRRTVHAPRETAVGGATLFVFPITRYIHLGAEQPAPVPLSQAEPPGTIKMIVAIVSQQQSDQLLKTLTDWSYRGTLMSTTGGFLHRRNATVLIGARSERVDSIVDQIRQVCEIGPHNATAATLFILDSARYERM